MAKTFSMGTEPGSFLAKFRTPTFDSPTTNVISGLGATRTLEAHEAFSLIHLDRAAGIILTLPTPQVGMTFEFVASVSVTSNNYKVITSAGTVFLVGTYVSVDTDTADALVGFSGNGSTHVAVTMNGTTTGGLVGTSLRFDAVSTTLWVVTGFNRGSGVVATAFATS